MDDDYAESTPYMDALRELAEVKAERDRAMTAIRNIADAWGVTADSVVERYARKQEATS